MAYPSIYDDDFVENLLRRKEYYQLKDTTTSKTDAAYSRFHLHSQQIFAKNYINPHTKKFRYHLSHATGCFAEGTRIFRHDGSVVEVQDVASGEKLMGDDGTERMVLSTIRGSQKMYRVLIRYGNTYEVNEDHVLYVCHPESGEGIITVRQYCRLDREEQRKLKMVRGCVDFPRTRTYFSPKLQDVEMWLQVLRRLPKDLLFNTADVRRTLLLSLLDLLQEWRTADFVSIVVTREIKDDIIFLCNSLCCYCVEVDKNCLLVYLRPNPYLEFSVEEIGVGDYYGFETDGNHLFLGEDFTILHNTGKTLTAIAIADQFIKSYKLIYGMVSKDMSKLQLRQGEADRITPTVFVLGFAGAKDQFLKDLLSHPEFGFVTMEEYRELARLQLEARRGEREAETYRAYFKKLKRRVTKKQEGGFYKFYGYDEFVNRLFAVDHIKLTDLEEETEARIKSGEQVTLEEVVKGAIDAGKIRVNQTMIQRLKYGLLLCDEIHNTYNMYAKNNRGVAIQYALDTVFPLWFVSMSATPINNSPTEVVELVNYLVEPDRKISKKEFFSSGRNLYPGKLAEIGKLTRGRVSFLQDINPDFYPRRIIDGEEIILTRDIGDFRAGQPIPYLKFISCPMTPLHQHTYYEFLKDAAPVEGSEEIPYTDKKIPTDGFAIYDMVFPNPGGDDTGLFRTNETRIKIGNSSGQWQQKVGLEIKKGTYGGKFLSVENLVTRYSAKYGRAVSQLLETIKSARGDESKARKAIIYHDRVRGSGIVLIMEILKENHMIDEYSDPNDDTICSLCGYPLGSHRADGTVEGHGRGLTKHAYKPVRVVIAHSEIDKNILSESYAKINARDNARGTNYMVLLGSQIIRESLDLKAFRDLYLLSLPTNIPTMLQVWGRFIRKNSSVDLPPEDRDATIHIFVSTINKTVFHSDDTSPEIYKYIDKLHDYIVIQKIEREINMNAIDADLYRNIIMPAELLRSYFPDCDPSDEACIKKSQPVAMIGNLYFDPAVKLPSIANQGASVGTFNAYSYFREEIDTITFIIKQLFSRLPVWKYDDLWRRVQDPPFSVEVNPRLFSEYNFVIALHTLTASSTKVAFSGENFPDSTYRFVSVRGQKYKIVRVGQYYLLAPEESGKVTPDVETYLRPAVARGDIRFDVMTFVRHEYEKSRYQKFKSRILKKIREGLSSRHRSILTPYEEILATEPHDLQLRLIEECIEKWPPVKPEIGKYVEFLAGFGAILFGKMIEEKPELRQYFKGGVSRSRPIGYLLPRSARFFPPSGAWFELARSSVGKGTVPPENDSVIGYVEQVGESSRFKLRSPRTGKQKLADARMAEKGMVCTTKTKEELVSIAEKLGLEPSKKKVKYLCAIIYKKLLDNERMHTERKWFYGFWDRLPK